uniref:Uncharacterized protein n=1 Tax=Chelydra serpentina TaxID=8475 RepID=A0A8C3SMD7_CHESE
LCTHSDFPNFLLVDGDVVPVDIDVGQTHVGDSLVAPPVVILLIDGEGHQGVVAPAVLGQGVGAGALEVEVQPIERVIVRVPPAPAGSNQVGNTHRTAVLDLERNPSSPWSDSTESALITLCLYVHISSCLTLALSFTYVDALQDSISDLTGFIAGAAVGFTGHPLGRNAGAV